MGIRDHLVDSFLDSFDKKSNITGEGVSKGLSKMVQAGIVAGSMLGVLGGAEDAKAQDEVYIEDASNIAVSVSPGTEVRLGLLLPETHNYPLVMMDVDDITGSTVQYVNDILSADALANDYRVDLTREIPSQYREFVGTSLSVRHGYTPVMEANAADGSVFRFSFTDGGGTTSLYRMYDDVNIDGHLIDMAYELMAGPWEDLTSDPNHPENIFMSSTTGGSGEITMVPMSVIEEFTADSPILDDADYRISVEGTSNSFAYIMPLNMAGTALEDEVVLLGTGNDGFGALEVNPSTREGNLWSIDFADFMSSMQGSCTSRDTTYNAFSVFNSAGDTILFTISAGQRETGTFCVNVLRATDTVLLNIDNTIYVDNTGDGSYDEVCEELIDGNVQIINIRTGETVAEMSSNTGGEFRLMNSREDDSYIARIFSGGSVYTTDEFTADVDGNLHINGALSASQLGLEANGVINWQVSGGEGFETVLVTLNEEELFGVSGQVSGLSYDDYLLKAMGNCPAGNEFGYYEHGYVIYTDARTLEGECGEVPSFEEYFLIEMNLDDCGWVDISPGDTGVTDTGIDSDTGFGDTSLDTGLDSDTSLGDTGLDTGLDSDTSLGDTGLDTGLDSDTSLGDTGLDTRVFSDTEIGEVGGEDILVVFAGVVNQIADGGLVIGGLDFSVADRDVLVEVTDLDGHIFFSQISGDDGLVFMNTGDLSPCEEYVIGDSTRECSSLSVADYINNEYYVSFHTAISDHVNVVQLRENSFVYGYDTVDPIETDIIGINTYYGPDRPRIVEEGCACSTTTVPYGSNSFPWVLLFTGVGLVALREKSNNLYL